MESPEKKFGDDYLYRMREEELWKVEKSAEFQELRNKADVLSGKFPIITDLFEGTHMEDAHELTKEERQVIRNYVEIQGRIMEIHEFAHYYRGHGDCILHLKRCGFFDEGEENRLSLRDMTELIRIHDTYKALNSALFGEELVLDFADGYIGSLGRIYKIIDDITLDSMQHISSEILADTSMDAEKRAKLLLQGKDL